MAAGWMNGGMPGIAMFRFMPGGGGTRGKGRGGRRPMLRVLESAICVFSYSLSIPHFSVTSISRLFLCSPHGSAADLQLKLVEILTRGLGRRRAGDRRPALHRWTRWRGLQGGRRREGQPLLPPQPPPKALDLLSLLAFKPQLSNPACLQRGGLLQQSMCAGLCLI